MRVVLFLLLSLCATAVQAQTILPCTAGCPQRYYFETQPCTAGSCARSATPAASEFQLSKGMSLADAAGWTVQVCAASGQTISGTGTLRVWTWNPWNPSDVSSSKVFDLKVADVWTASICGGSNCRCVHWPDFAVGGHSARRVMVSSVDVAVSGGSSIEVRLVGLMR